MNPPPTDPPNPSPLEYAGPDTRPATLPPWRARAMRVALICWAAPLLVGLTTFGVDAFARYLTDRQSHGSPPCTPCVMVGLWDILIGTGLAAVGGVAVLVFASEQWGPAAGQRWRRVVGPALLVTGLLLSNFGVAAALVYVAVRHLI